MPRLFPLSYLPLESGGLLSQSIIQYDTLQQQRSRHCSPVLGDTRVLSRSPLVTCCLLLLSSHQMERTIQCQGQLPRESRVRSSLHLPPSSRPWIRWLMWTIVSWGYTASRSIEDRGSGAMVLINAFSHHSLIEVGRMVLLLKQLLADTWLSIWLLHARSDTPAATTKLCLSPLRKYFACLTLPFNFNTFVYI